MILLTDTNDKLQVITSATTDLDVVISYADMSSSTFAVSGLGKQLTTITTATTTDVLAAPAASTVRNMKQLTARNAHATIAVDVTVQYNDNATVYELHKVTLQPGDCLEFVEGIGFYTLTNISSGRLITNVESDYQQRAFRSVLSQVAQGTFVMVSGTAYYVYMGRVAQAITVAYVEFHVTSAGAGAQTAEVGIFSTPTAPSKSAQTLTKLAATGTVGALTGTGMLRNSSSLATLVPAGTHLWGAFRTAMATTQPTITGGLVGDKSQGRILTTTGGGALTGLTTASGGLVTLGVATVAPELIVTID
jgi:plastocyanin